MNGTSYVDEDCLLRLDNLDGGANPRVERLVLDLSKATNNKAILSFTEGGSAWGGINALMPEVSGVSKALFVFVCSAHNWKPSAQRYSPQYRFERVVKLTVTTGGGCSGLNLGQQRNRTSILFR